MSYIETLSEENCENLYGLFCEVGGLLLLRFIKSDLYKVLIELIEEKEKSV